MALVAEPEATVGGRSVARHPPVEEDRRGRAGSLFGVEDESARPRFQPSPVRPAQADEEDSPGRLAIDSGDEATPGMDLRPGRPTGDLHPFPCRCCGREQRGHRRDQGDDQDHQGHGPLDYASAFNVLLPSSQGRAAARGGRVAGKHQKAGIKKSQVSKKQRPKARSQEPKSEAKKARQSEAKCQPESSRQPQQKKATTRPLTHYQFPN